MTNKVVIIGAGQTGRGLIPRFLTNSQITFIDQNKQLVQQLQHQASYSIHFADRPSYLVEDYLALHTEDLRIQSTLNQAKVILISVGSENIKDVTCLLHSTLDPKLKKMIILAENGIGNAEYMRSQFQNDFWEILEALVFCTTISQKSLDIFSESTDYFPCNIGKLKKSLSFVHFDVEPDTEKLMRRKIFTYNALSAVIAYLGLEKGYEIYSEAANDREIRSILIQTQKELDKGLSQVFGISISEQHTFSQRAIDKFSNPNIIDTISRNVRNPLKKLGPNERINGPLKILSQYGIHSEGLEKTKKIAEKLARSLS